MVSYLSNGKNPKSSKSIIKESNYNRKMRTFNGNDYFEYDGLEDFKDDKASIAYVPNIANYKDKLAVACGYSSEDDCACVNIFDDVNNRVAFYCTESREEAENVAQEIVDYILNEYASFDDAIKKFNFKTVNLDIF